VKKYFILVAVWLVSIVAVIVGSQLYEKYQATGYDELAVPFIQQVIPEFSTWDPEIVKPLMAAEVLAEIPDQKFVQILAVFSKLGTLQSMGIPEFQKVHSQEKTDNGTQTVIVYDTETKYENGEALITLNLLQVGDSFEIFRFNLSSNTLVE